MAQPQLPSAMESTNKFQTLLSAADPSATGLLSIPFLLNSQSLPSLKKSFSRDYFEISAPESPPEWTHSSFSKHQETENGPGSDETDSSTSIDEHRQNLKPKRKRISPEQLKVLNSVFQTTYFPSTQLRISLGLQLKLSPRTIQIWFQNRRQAYKIKCKNERPLSNGESKMSFAKERAKMKQTWSVFVPNDLKSNNSILTNKQKRGELCRSHSVPCQYVHLPTMSRSLSLPGPEFTNNGIPFVPSYAQNK